MLRASGWQLVFLAVAVGMFVTGCGDDRCTCPEADEFAMTYLFRDAWGDCPSGCTSDRYWYFECSGGGCEFIGTWEPDVEPAVPLWWARARAAVNTFRAGGEVPNYPWAAYSDVASTPRSNREAEEAALWLSGSLVAPPPLYSRIQEDLLTIRQTYGERFPRLNTLFFRSEWASSELIVLLSDEAKEEFLRGEYHDLDSLNSEFGLVSMDSLFSSLFTLRFAGRFHPVRLAEIYGEVESVVFAVPNWFYGDFPNVYPWREDESQ